MSELSQMTLKILYTLDNGSNGSYLARSRAPKQVRVANIPSPFPTDSNEQTELRIGAIHLKTILHEIYLNSPEVLDHDTLKDGYDYNLYYRDICEVDEPLVSLGLLSGLRKKFHKNSPYQYTENNIGEEESEERDEVTEEEYEDESFIVTGRVCSNVSALLRRSYSNISNKKGRVVNNQIPEETLEVKLRFTKVITNLRTSGNNTTNSRISCLQMPSSLPSATLPFTPKSQSLFKTNQIKNSRNARTTITINNTNSGTVGRRQTNPMPAPKAVRTQSLPIWNLKPNIANTGFPRNSIAHKIYLADRKTEANQQNNQHQNIAYEINTLQNDNTIQRTKIDDSVSKRFDFMLNKRKSTKKVSPGIATIAKKPASININPKQPPKTSGEKKANDKQTIVKVKNSNSKNSAKSTQAGCRRSSVVEHLNDHDDSILSDILSEPGIEGQKLQQKQKGRKISLTSENDKENIPPQSITSKENKLEGDLDFNAEFPMSDFSDVVFKDEMGWFSNFNCNFFESPTSASASQLNQQNLKPSITLNDPNTCNTIALENEDVSELETAQNNKISLPSDVDKTSPIDSLSIPLIELTHSSSTTNMQRISIKEGSTLNITDSNNATPCDNDIKDRKASVIDSDNTKPQAGLINFSTPADQPASDNNVTASKKLTSMLETQQSKRSHEEVLDEEEEEEALKKQKAIPSSPCGMFNYHQPMELSEDIVEEEQGHNIGDDNESDKTNDLFSTFIHSGIRVSQVVTSPIGEFQSIKH